MLTVEYDPNEGLVIPDEKIEPWVLAAVQEYKKNGAPDHLRIGSELMIAAFRLVVKRKILAPEQIVFSFGNEKIPINKDGRLPRWPNGFCDHTDKFLDEMLEL